MNKRSKAKPKGKREPVEVDHIDQQEPVADRKQLAAISKVAGRIKSFRPADQVLTNVVAVPTEFPGLNLATRCGGWPVERIGLVHGPSNNGKTEFVLGLGKSFLKRNHFFAFVDAEFTTPFDWVTKLMGEYANHPGFIAKRPTGYAETTAAVREVLTTVSDARKRKEIDSNTTGLIVVDSLKKLVPENLMEKLLKEEGGVDGMSGRAAMYQAALNSQWLQELVPMLYHCKMGLVFIGREMENSEKRNPYDKTWKLGGGKGVFFDSSLVVRVVRGSWLKKGEQVVGERMLCTVYKTKVGGKEDTDTEFHFNSSNGVMIPEGFDTARDYLDVALEQGWFTKSGNSIVSTMAGDVWDNQNHFVEDMRDHPEVFKTIRGSIDRKIVATMAQV